MYLGRVVGTVVSTSKDPSLSGAKLLIVARLDQHEAPDGSTEIAVDTVGAGPGETVIVTTSSAARMTDQLDGSVADASIVGIVDTVEAH